VVATDVTGVSKGDRVFVVSEGTWTPALTLPIEQVTSTPGLSATHAASLSYFASAWGLLHNFTSLQAGDIVVQTHSNTAVGKAITQLGHALGLNVISLTETEAMPANLSKKLSEVTGYKLAITGQAGRHISTLQRFVPTTVLYSGLYAPASRILNVELPIGHMVFSGASLHGFDARTWSRSNPADYLAAVRHVVRLAEQKKVDLTPAVVVSKEKLNQAVDEVARTGTSVVLEGL
jgi:NADPH:quinone reductase-like Zn-dependent oxidoreductase